MPPSAPRRTQSLVVAGVAAVVVYLIVRRHVISSDELIFFAVLVPSIILHEVSHGVVALFFGDDTAKQAGRLTLNPVPHIDPFGSVVLPAILLLAHSPAFGYAKPVPVNLRRLRHPRNDGLLVSLAGPATNVLLAVAAALVLRFSGLLRPAQFGTLTYRFVVSFGLANVLLAAFNLIPLPPLDGSAVVERLLPRQWWPGYLQLRQYALPALFLIVLLRPSILTGVFQPAENLWIRLLG